MLVVGGYVAGEEEEGTGAALAELQQQGNSNKERMRRGDWLVCNSKVAATKQMEMVAIGWSAIARQRQQRKVGAVLSRRKAQCEAQRV